jgi:hypothetical protein
LAGHSFTRNVIILLTILFQILRWWFFTSLFCWFSMQNFGFIIKLLQFSFVLWLKGNKLFELFVLLKIETLRCIIKYILLSIYISTFTCLRILNLELFEQDMYFGEPLVLYVGKQPIKHLKWDMSVPVTGPIYSNIVLGTTTGFLLLTVSPKVSSSLEKYGYIVTIRWSPCLLQIAIKM